MLRRVFALILALACAFAPALWAVEQAAPDAHADSCCCGTQCACPPTDCAPPPAAPANTAPPSAPATEQRTVAARPRARALIAFFAHFLSAPPSEPALTVRTRATHANGFAPAARIALFEAHCSFLI